VSDYEAAFVVQEFAFLASAMLHSKQLSAETRAQLVTIQNLRPDLFAAAEAYKRRVEEATRRPLVNIEHWAKPPLNEYCGPQATALRQAAERSSRPRRKNDDQLWLVLLSRTVEQFAQERGMWWPVGGARSNRAETVCEVVEEGKRRLDEEERGERVAQCLATES
jgi:hypothetical protein